LNEISSKDVLNAFDTQNVKVFTDSNLLVKELYSLNWNNTNLLLMSSGNFDGIDFENLAQNLLG
ncbi:MAG: peptidoglycan synthetase, partial [Rickettsiales bacterium]|nr:peptidoglycan synthetase [Rickettsiales bacterium]